MLSGLFLWWALVFPIGLMHDCVTCSKFTTKPRLRELFSNLWHLCVIFMWEFFSSWLLWEFVLVKILQVVFFKARLGGEKSWRDVNMHKGYYSVPLEPLTHHTSHITHHTSHITHHTSHITHHTSHITQHTSHNTHH